MQRREDGQRSEQQGKCHGVESEHGCDQSGDGRNSVHMDDEYALERHRCDHRRRPQLVDVLLVEWKTLGGHPVLEQKMSSC